MYIGNDTYTGLVKKLVPLPLGSEQVAVQGRIAHAPTFIRRCTSICTSHVTSTLSLNYPLPCRPHWSSRSYALCHTSRLTCDLPVTTLDILNESRVILSSGDNDANLHMPSAHPLNITPPELQYETHFHDVRGVSRCRPRPRCIRASAPTPCERTISVSPAKIALGFPLMVQVQLSCHVCIVFG